MHRSNPAVPVIIIILYAIMATDARILGGIVCIPAGILMLRQCRPAKSENPDEYDLVAVIGGILLLSFGGFILLNYLFR